MNTPHTCKLPLGLRSSSPGRPFRRSTPTSLLQLKAKRLHLVKRLDLKYHYPRHLDLNGPGCENDSSVCLSVCVVFVCPTACAATSAAQGSRPFGKARCATTLNLGARRRSLTDAGPPCRSLISSPSCETPLTSVSLLNSKLSPPCLHVR